VQGHGVGDSGMSTFQSPESVQGHGITTSGLDSYGGPASLQGPPVTGSSMSSFQVCWPLFPVISRKQKRLCKHRFVAVSAQIPSGSDSAVYTPLSGAPSGGESRLSGARNRRLTCCFPYKS